MIFLTARTGFDGVKALNQASRAKSPREKGHIARNKGLYGAKGHFLAWDGPPKQGCTAQRRGFYGFGLGGGHKSPSWGSIMRGSTAQRGPIQGSFLSALAEAGVVRRQRGVVRRKGGSEMGLLGFHGEKST